MLNKSNTMQNNSQQLSYSKPGNFKWYLAATGSAALIALVAIATKGGVTIIGTDWFLTLMFAVSIPFLIPYDLIGADGFKAFSSRTGSKRYFFCHALFTGAAWIIYTNGVTLLSASIAVFVSRTESILIIVFAGIFLKEHLGFRVVLAALIALSGIILIDRTDLSEGVSLQGSADLRRGITLIVTSGALFAAGEIFARKAIDTWDSRIFTLLRNAALLPIFFALAIFSDSILIWNLEAVGWAVVAAVCGPVGARILYLNCIRHIPVSHAAVMTNSEPIFGFILGFLVFADRPSIGPIAGASLIVAAILTLVVKRGHTPFDP